MADMRQVTKLTTWVYGVDYFLGAPIGMPNDSRPVRTVYNTHTHQHEEFPLTQFQLLLRQGKIEESVSQSPYDGHPQRTYRLT